MRRQHKHRDEGGGVQLGLIITPMLDMSFQLMAFFIMTYHPSALEGHIDGNLLPPTLTANKAKNADPMPSDLPAVDDEPTLQDVILVVVKSVPRNKDEGQLKDGEPNLIQLKRPEDPAPVNLAEMDNAVPVEKTLGDGLKKLTAELKTDAGSKANIKIEADGDLKHRYLMEVYDACKQAGFQNISFVAPPREK